MATKKTYTPEENFAKCAKEIASNAAAIKSWVKDLATETDRAERVCAHEGIASTLLLMLNDMSTIATLNKQICETTTGDPLSHMPDLGRSYGE